MSDRPDLTTYDGVIFDFDGPMCHVFAGYPAADVAEDLRQHLYQAGWDPDHEMPLSSDPLQVLAEVHRTAPQYAQYVEDRLQVSERRAIGSATQAPGIREVLRHLAEAGIPVAVASNNSSGAIEQWLAIQELDDLVGPVVGRHPTNVELMKPNPWSLLRACDGLGIAPVQCVFIGDSVTDAQAAQAVGTPFLALADKAHKAESFAEAGYVMVIGAVGELLVSAPGGPTR